MANAMYAKGKQHILAGDVDFDADTIKAVFLDGADYTPNLSTDDVFTVVRVSIDGTDYQGVSEVCPVQT